MRPGTLPVRICALGLGGFVGCFTGDGLLEQPCRSDDDCNAVADAFGRRIACTDGVCGAVCGDGLRVEAVEECDDGNDIDTDACVGCKLAVCGDDVTRAGIEACDDGNTVATDACTGCKLAVCGDGVVWTGEEECDDGNDIDADTCAGCRTVACGDGRVNPATELCDDDNRANDDGCDAQCRFGAEALASGQGDHTCALRAGALRCWGANDVGQLGYGSIALVGDEPNDLPPRDVDLPAPVLAVALGAEHTCALLDDDSVRCWGSNSLGQLGLPGLGPIGDERDEPLGPSVALGGAAVELTAGARHTCARLTDQAVRCWGDNTYGQLGYPKLANIGVDDDAASHPPLALPPTRQLSAGGLHTCAVLATDRSVRCWGRNFSFQLGVETPGTVLSDPSAAQSVALDGQAVAAVSAGGSHTCAILAADGGVRCWGGNDLGQVGHDEVLSDDDGVPTAKVGAVDLEGRRAEQLQAGMFHTCAVVEDGAVWCWGRVLAGGAASISPPARVPLDGLARHAAVGASHTCVRFDGGVVRCWGSNLSGQLGLGHTQLGDEPGELPGPPLETGGNVAQITRSCLLLVDGAVRCWDLLDPLKDLPPVPLPGPAIQIESGESETCAVLESGELWCFYGAIVYKVFGARKVAQIAMGATHRCARFVEGDVKCWGNNYFGQLGDPTLEKIEFPDPQTVGAVPLGEPAVDIAAGMAHTCAVLASGGVKCWGRNLRGELGHPVDEILDPAAFAPIALGGPARAVIVAADHTCALLHGGEVDCWGSNASGALGVGHSEDIGDDAMEMPPQPTRLHADLL